MDALTTKSAQDRLTISGWTNAQASKICKQISSDKIGDILLNPYKAIEVRGIGFSAADNVAIKFIGLALDSPERLKAATDKAMSDYCKQKGHTLIEARLLAKVIDKLLNNETHTQKAIQQNITTGDIVQFNGMIAHKRLHDAERTISQYANKVTLMTAQQPPAQGHLTDEQYHAVKEVYNNRITVITGDAGSGKTTTIAALAEGATLLAPTGKAAKRMKQATHCNASTIHKLLMKPEPTINDIVVIDEASMIDVSLLAWLIRNIEKHNPKSRLVLVGDPQQLPPVGAGRPFADLIESKAVAHVHLSKVHRQAVDSPIIAQANNWLKHGALDEQQQNENFKIGKATIDNLRIAVDQLINVQREKPENIQILAPCNSYGELSCDPINDWLKHRLNPDKDDLVYGYRAGDRMMCTANNYDLGVMNGDQLTATKVNADQTLTATTDEGDEVIIEQSDQRDFRLAYCITTHKSQGSEWNSVIVVAPQANAYVMSKEWVYTSLTRAKQNCIVLADDETQKELGCKKSMARNTALPQLLKKEKTDMDITHTSRTKNNDELLKSTREIHASLDLINKRTVKDFGLFVEFTHEKRPKGGFVIRSIPDDMMAVFETSDRAELLKEIDFIESDL